jgi:hypothetical protein
LLEKSKALAERVLARINAEDLRDEELQLAAAPFFVPARCRGRSKKE